jgi:hypothetical protein
MNRFGILLAAALAIAIPMAAQEKAQPDAKSSPAAKQLTTDELRRYLEQKGKYVFLDVREAKELEDLGTVENHIHIPLGDLENRLNELPKDKLIITL